MPELKLNTGSVKLKISDDRDGSKVRYIEFNPNDIIFAEKVYALERKFLEKQESMQAKAQALDAVEETDEFDLPVNTEERLAFIREISEWLRDQIDDLFGEGTSDAVFGDLHSLDVYEQFFDGIKPYFKKARSEKVDQYRRKVIEDRKKIEADKAAKE
ncbi:MAG: hypothetical protein SVT56_04935 [Chloroflexota bacterium]|nr:hypothetical protein [Chloroflexota bacterium]